MSAAGLTYDTGALIAAERDDRLMSSLHRVAIARGRLPTVPAGVLAEARRGGPQARLSMLLKGCRIEELGEAPARLVGGLIARSVSMTSWTSRWQREQCAATSSSRRIGRTSNTSRTPRGSASRYTTCSEDPAFGDAQLQTLRRVHQDGSNTSRNTALVCCDMATEQIAVRLPEQQLAVLDDLVERGVYDSRAAVVRAGIAAIAEVDRRREVDRAIVDGYRRHPPTESEQKAAITSLRDAIAEEPW